MRKVWSLQWTAKRYGEEGRSQIFRNWNPDDNFGNNVAGLGEQGRVAECSDSGGGAGHKKKQPTNMRAD